MTAPEADNARRRQIGEKASLASLAAISLALNSLGFTWGLPNGDGIWSTDALTPMAPLSVVHRLVAGGWNSGWFYYKYPTGHPLLVAAAYAPYLAWLKLTGELGRPVSEYPYGFTNPEGALFTLALIQRGVSALMTTGAVILWHLACREVVSRRAAWLAAVLMATMFPVVFYAHTGNVDGPLLFWCALALYGTARVYARRIDRTGTLLIGIGSAMALSTKEYAVGLVGALPLLIAGARVWQRHREGAPLNPFPAGWAAGVAVAALLFVIANGIFINPLGMWNRIQFLRDAMPEETRQQYAPRFSHVGSGAPKSLANEVVQLQDTVSQAARCLGWPAAVIGLLGVAAVGWRVPGLFFLVPALGYYLLSLRALEMLQPRYVIPLCVLLTGLAGLAIDKAMAGLRAGVPRAAGMTAMAGLVVFGAARGAEAVWLLRHDNRYAAERWFRANVPPGATVEVYQRLAYLPRFPDTVNLVRVGFEQVSVPEFEVRRPDIVVISSAGQKGITSRFRNELDAEGEGEERKVSRRGSTGEAMSFEYKRNRLFLEALEAGCLEYRRAAVFENPPRLSEPMIPSLSPTIHIYRREDTSAGPAGSSPRCRELLAEARQSAVEAQPPAGGA